MVCPMVFVPTLQVTGDMTVRMGHMGQSRGNTALCLSAQGSPRSLSVSLRYTLLFFMPLTQTVSYLSHSRYEAGYDQRKRAFPHGTNHGTTMGQTAKTWDSTVATGPSVRRPACISPTDQQCVADRAAYRTSRTVRSALPAVVHGRNRWYDGRCWTPLRPLRLARLRRP